MEMVASCFPVCLLASLSVSLASVTQTTLLSCSVGGIFFIATVCSTFVSDKAVTEQRCMNKDGRQRTEEASAKDTFIRIKSPLLLFSFRSPEGLEPSPQKLLVVRGRPKANTKRELLPL